MSLERARRVLLDKLGGARAVLLALLLDLAEVPAWCDGQDTEGRAVLLVGKHTRRERAFLVVPRQAGHQPQGIIRVSTYDIHAHSYTLSSERIYLVSSTI